MKLIVGLGNSGNKYKNNRHNVGFMVVDKIVTSNKAQVTRGPNPKLVICYSLHNNITLAQPQIFMNESGKAVKKIIAHFGVKLADLWIVHDDLDLRLGTYKIQNGVGPKLHYGISSIEEYLGAKDFWRVRIGVDNRSAGGRVPGEKYVLQDFNHEELKVLGPVIDKIVGELINHVIKTPSSKP